MTPVDITSLGVDQLDYISDRLDEYNQKITKLLFDSKELETQRAIVALNEVKRHFTSTNFDDESFDAYFKKIGETLDGRSLPYFIEMICADHAKNLSTARGLQGAIALHAASKKDNLKVKVHWDDWQLNRSMFDSNLHFAKIMISRKVTKASAKTVQNWCTSWEKMKK